MSRFRHPERSEAKSRDLFWRRLVAAWRNKIGPSTSFASLTSLGMTVVAVTCDRRRAGNMTKNHKPVSGVSPMRSAAHIDLVGELPRGEATMLNRRSLTMGGLVFAAASSWARIGRAQAGRPMLVFVGHEL